MSTGETVTEDGIGDHKRRERCRLTTSDPSRRLAHMNRQRLGLWGTFVFSALAVIGVLVQVYLIGGFLFGESGWLDTHRDMGKLVHLFYVLTFVSALVAAWPEWRKTGWPFALAALGTVQAFLAGGSGLEKQQDGAIHAFHAALVPIVFVIAFMIAWRTWKMLQGTTSTTETATT